MDKLHKHDPWFFSVDIFGMCHDILCDTWTKLDFGGEFILEDDSPQDPKKEEEIEDIVTTTDREERRQKWDSLERKK